MNDQKTTGVAWDAAINTQAGAVVPSPCSLTEKCVRPRLHQLAHDLRDMCRRISQGAHRTQIDRQRTLLLCTKQLFQQGMRRRRAVNLDAQKIHGLFGAWHAGKLIAATIRNRSVHLRWLARKIAKPEIVASDHVYGVGGDK